MGFQSTVALNQGFGVIGELAFDGPQRATPGVIKGTAANLVVGRAFTIDPADGQYQPGVLGAANFGGILSNPKGLASVGAIGGSPLSPTLTVPAGTVGEFLNMGQVIVALLNAANIGDKVTYATADGQLSALPAQVSATGSIATTVLTVSAVAAGSAPILPGTVINGPNIVPGTTVISNGTGTGGTGTYNVSVSQTAASAAISGDSVAASGQVIIPRAKVVRYANAAAGLAVIALTDA